MQKARSLRFALCALRVRVVSASWKLENARLSTVDCALESCLYQHQPALLALALAPYKSKFPVKPKPQTQPAIGVLSFLLLVVGVRRPWLPLPRSQKGSKPKTQDARCCWPGYAPRPSCHLSSSIHLRAAARAERWAILPCAPLHIPALLGFGSWFFVLLSDLPHSLSFPLALLVAGSFPFLSSDLSPLFPLLFTSFATSSFVASQTSLQHLAAALASCRRHFARVAISTLAGRYF